MRDITGEGALVQRVDAYGEIAHHIIGNAVTPLDLLHGFGRAIDIEQRIVALALLLDRIGEVTQSPVFGLGHLRALVAQELCEFFGDRLDLGRARCLVA